jgi:hypothetical protein
MDKVIQLTTENNSYFYNTLEPVLQVIDPDRLNEKVASEALDYIKDVKPKDGKTTILVIAMGAGENYGANRNGDYFPEEDLKKNFKNFETKFDKEGKINGGALIFKHHKNKIAKGHPYFGIVKKAFYNDDMHRVELLLEVDNEKAPDIKERIENGDNIPVSMGVRIPWDKCSCCGKKSAKVAEYCDHLRYEMNRIYPDGRKAYAINGEYDYEKHAAPLNFFDISFVFRPADQTGYMIKKVANHSTEEKLEPSAILAEKQANILKRAKELKKLSVIQKKLMGQAVAAKDEDGETVMLDKFKNNGLDRVASNMQEMPKEVLNDLSTYPLNKVIATLNKNNILLTTPEFVYMVVKKSTGVELPKELLYDAVKKQCEVFEHLADNPDHFDELASMDMFKEVEPSKEIEEKISAFINNRDLSEEGILKKADTQFLRSVLDVGDIVPNAGELAKGMTRTYEVNAPDGKTYVASQDAVEEAQFWQTFRDAAASFGAAGALAGVYIYSQAKNTGTLPRFGGRLAGAAAVLMGLKGLADFASRYDRGTVQTTTPGVKIPKETVMMEKKNSLRSTTMGVLTPIGGTALLNRYYQNRLEKGIAGVHRTPLEKWLDTLGAGAYYHPYLFGGTGIAGTMLGQSALQKLRDSARSFSGKKI